MDQGTGTGRRKGTQQNTAGDAQQPRNTQRAGGSEDKRREGREERGTRMAARLGSGGGKHEDDTRQQAGNRERSGREQTDRKKYVIYLRER